MGCLFRTTGMVVVVAVATAVAVMQLPRGSCAFELSPNGGNSINKAGIKSRSAACTPLSASTMLPSNMNSKEQQQQQQQQQGQHAAAFLRPKPPSRPPPLKRRTLYDILGASSTTESRAQLKQRYVHLVRLCHPDALLRDKGDNKYSKHAEPLPPPSGHSSPSLDFNEINMAWRMLSNTESRKKYDEFLAEQQQQQPSILSPPVPPQPAISKSDGGGKQQRPMKKYPWEDAAFWEDFTEGVMSRARDQVVAPIVKAVERAILPFGGL
jgi:hypothetical protein